MGMKTPPRKRCKGRVWSGYRQVGCNRYASVDGYCYQHHPEAVERRREENMQRQLEKWNNSPEQRWKRRAEAAEEKVRELQKALHIYEAKYGPL
jgi:hypothetical protein